MKFFDESGRRIPTETMRVFGDQPSYYYAIKEHSLDYTKILGRLKKAKLVEDLEISEFEKRADSLLASIEADRNYSNILKGPHLPFAVDLPGETFDLGEHLEQSLLPKLERSFTDAYPDYHFKAVLQGDADLVRKITLDDNARYQQLIHSAQKSSVVGWYFPQAFQEFDVESQRRQMRDLPDLDGGNVCLSGGIDMVASLVGLPSLLVNEDSYPPILCMSAYVHADSRLVLLLKAYGPHLEFWCMTQMLTPEVTQVSEQWAGGLTIFS